MKRILLISILLFSLLCLSSCFIFGKTTTYPDMVEYTKEEVLLIAKEKYDISRFIFDDAFFKGELNGESEEFSVIDYSSQFSVDFVNGDNIENAFRAFAGKNGGHDVQGYYHSFLCYVALAECEDGSLKYIYYNTNIHKDADIRGTIGASDYTFDISPEEITNSLFTAPNGWSSMIMYLKQYQNLSPKGFIYSRDRLTTESREGYRGITTIEYYREGDKVVFDLYYDPNEYDNEENRELVYSTSDRYGVIYNYYGLDLTEYFNITTNVTQSTEQESCLSFKVQVEAKEIKGTVLYSRYLYSAEYYIAREEGAILHGTANETVTNQLNFECGWMLDKIDGIDHAQTAKFKFTRFYIFYEKNTKTE